MIFLIFTGTSASSSSRQQRNIVQLYTKRDQPPENNNHHYYYYYHHRRPPAALPIILNIIVTIIIRRRTSFPPQATWEGRSWSRRSGCQKTSREQRRRRTIMRRMMNEMRAKRKPKSRCVCCNGWSPLVIFQMVFKGLSDLKTSFNSAHDKNDDNIHEKWNPQQAGKLSSFDKKFLLENFAQGVSLSLGLA